MTMYRVPTGVSAIHASDWTQNFTVVEMGDNVFDVGGTHVPTWAARVGAVALTTPESDAITAAKARVVAKKARESQISVLTVTTTSGKVFDANEQALTRLTNAYTIGVANNIATTSWTLSNNTRVTVTLAEITEAMTLAGLAQNTIWGI